jgi:hypothetical protein
MARTPPIHSSIKKALGYEPNQSDNAVLKDWKERTRRVCKPCWELKYCPYGPLVEQSPLLPSKRQDIIDHNDYLKRALETSVLGEMMKVDAEERNRL